MCGVCSGFAASHCVTDDRSLGDAWPGNAWPVNAWLSDARPSDATPGREHGFGGGQLTGPEIHAAQTGSGETAKAFGGPAAMADAIARAGAKWGDVGFGTPGGEVTFSFSDYRGGGALAFTAEGRVLVVDALRMIADVADVTFAWADDGDFETSDSQAGDIVYSQYGTSPSGGGFGGWSGSRGGGDPTWTIEEGEVAVDGQNVSLFLHETMHALGLSHPGEYNGPGATYEADAAFWDDTAQFTLMSYFEAARTGGNYARDAHTNMMLYDIATLQMVYGANDATRAGDTVYGFNATALVEGSLAQAGAAGAPGEVDASWRLDDEADDIVGAIWDAGGRDTIDLSGFTSASDVDLREGGFSSFGGLTNNLAIAFGAVIEDAIGGAGDDTLHGNAAGNELTGNAGNDVLVGGAGGDLLDGGAGLDTASYAEAAAAVTVDMLDTSRNEGEAAGDTFVAIESLVGSQYSDTLKGGAVANTLSGRGGNDALFGRGGADQLFGEAGNDILFGGAGGDFLNGGRGFDYVSYTDSSSGIVIDVLSPQDNAGDATGDVLALIENLVGSNFADIVRGGNVANELLGRNGADVIDGRGGADLIDGGGSADILTGGQGYDTFRYQLAGESRANAADTITDFDRAFDLIDLSRVDADEAAAGHQPFAFIGQAAFGGAAGELRYAVSGDDARVEADLNGDGLADMAIDLLGITQLTVADFTL